MVLLFSKSNDEFTNNVINFLPKNYFLRVGTDLDLVIDEFKLTDENFEFKISTKYKSISSKSINSIWFNGLEIGNETDFKSNSDLFLLLRSYKEEAIKGFIYNISFRSIGTIANSKLNKLKVLKLAKEVGLKIPKTILTEKKTSLIRFIEDNNLDQIITKRFSGEGIYREKNILYDISKTSLITKNNLKDIPEYFGISLFQEKIEKKIEIRIIFFNETIHSAAIFDQSIDYREKLKRNDKPRIVPYKLPERVKAKIVNLMNHLEMNSGSIDIIEDRNSRFFFLEVNPIGQIGFINDSCNYYLEEIFANYLTQK